MIGSGISQTMDSASTLTTKLGDIVFGPLERWIEDSAKPNPFAVELATQRINELKQAVAEGGNNPYTNDYIPGPDE